MSRPAWGTAPIKCGNSKCDWTGTERDLITHPDDVGKFSQRSVCPKCRCDNYTFPRRKGISRHSLVTEVEPLNVKLQPTAKSVAF